MPEKEQTSGTASETGAALPVPPSNLIDLYKHHFDLFLKGYALQLGVLAAVAGFAFDDGATRLQSLALLMFGGVVCVVCAMAWHLGMRWRAQFTLTLGAICRDRELGSVITSLSELILPLAFRSSLITALASFVCAGLVFVEDRSPAPDTKCACTLVKPLDDK